MHQPPGFAHPSLPHHICKLHKALYGLKQASKAWFSRLSTKLIDLGFIGSKADSSLFTFKSPLATVFILIYVDDIIITASISSAIDELLHQLKLEFAVKELGDLNYFLGVGVLHLKSGLLLSQRCYILDMLKRTNMLEAKPISSPMSTSSPLSAFVGDPMEDPSLFCSINQYLSLTRPDLAFSVNQVFSLCIIQQRFIGQLFNESYSISSILSLMVSSSHILLLLNLRPSLMLIGRGVQMITNLSMLIVCFLGQI